MWRCGVSSHVLIVFFASPILGLFSFALLFWPFQLLDLAALLVIAPLWLLRQDAAGPTTPAALSEPCFDRVIQ